MVEEKKEGEAKEVKDDKKVPAKEKEKKDELIQITQQDEAEYKRWQTKLRRADTATKKAIVERNDHWFELSKKKELFKSPAYYRGKLYSEDAYDDIIKGRVKEENVKTNDVRDLTQDEIDDAEKQKFYADRFANEQNKLAIEFAEFKHKLEEKYGYEGERWGLGKDRRMAPQD